MNALFSIFLMIASTHASENSTQTFKSFSSFTSTLRAEHRPNFIGLTIECGTERFLLSAGADGLLEARDAGDVKVPVLTDARSTSYLLNFSDGDQYREFLINDSLSRAIQLEGYWWSDGDHIAKSSMECETRSVPSFLGGLTTERLKLR